MRLFLSSYGLGGAPDELAALVREGGHAAIVLNALDGMPGGDALRASWLQEQGHDLAALGLRASELNLRDYFGQPSALRQALADVDLVWATGGNAFVLREAMQRSGLDALLPGLLGDRRIVYGGYSAGACVSGPTLRGIELVDDVHAVATPVWAGLGLVEFSLATHYQTPHPEAAVIERVVAYFRDAEMPYRALRDGEALIVCDGHERLVGRAT